MAVVSLILNLLIICLLAATITYAILLNRQLTRLRDGRGELDGLIREFGDATARAESGVKGMRRTTAEAGENLQKAIERAQVLRDELQFMIEAGDALASRLEGSAKSGAAGGALGGALGSGGTLPAAAERGVPAPRATLARPAARRAETGGRASAGVAVSERDRETAPRRPRAEPDPIALAVAEAREERRETRDDRRGDGREVRDDRREAREDRRNDVREDRRAEARDDMDGLSKAERELLHAIENQR